ncbi:hypothetical protein D6C91_03076, partial [Aureobasidium pullulans]
SLAAARTFSGADLNFGELDRTFTAPTINHAVKVPIGNQSFSLNVMIAEFEPPANTTTDLQNPRVAATIYELSWPWNTTINETLKTLEGVEEPRFCVSIPLGPIPDSVTKAYKETDLGDCTNALGEQCTRDLKNQGFAPDVGCNTPIPESCSGKLGSGSIGSAPLLNIEQKYYSAYEKSEARLLLRSIRLGTIHCSSMMCSVFMCCFLLAVEAPLSASGLLITRFQVQWLGQVEACALLRYWPSAPCYSCFETMQLTISYDKIQGA